MDLDRFRQAAAEQDARAAADPLGVVRAFLRAYFSDADGVDEVGAHITRSIQGFPRPAQRAVAAIDALLTLPLPEGALAELVAQEGNWVLEDRSDVGARAFLAEWANFIRAALAGG